MSELSEKEKKEHQRMSASLASLKIKIARQKEAEVKNKITLIDHQRLSKELEKKKGVEKVFEGKTITHIYPSPQKGISVRIKESIPDDPNLPTEFEWTIKFDSQEKIPARVLKNKNEIKPDVVSASFEDAKHQLELVLRALEISADLSGPQLVVGKRRVSYIVPNTGEEKKKGRYKPLRIDLDTFISVNGVEIEPRYVAEREDASNLSEAVKMRRIRALGEAFDLPMDPEYAGLSMKAFLIKEGIVREEYVLLESAIRSADDDAA